MFSVSSEETERFLYLPRVTQLLNSYWGQAGCKNSIVSESDVNSGTSWTKEVASCSVPRVGGLYRLQRKLRLKERRKTELTRL